MRTTFYTVRVHIMKTDKEGNNTHDEFDTIFDDENAPLIKLRNDATEKAKSYLTLFNVDTPKVDKNLAFSSFSEAEKKGFKDFNSYSLYIIFNNDGEEETIWGENDVLDGLEYEAFYYSENCKDVELSEITTLDGSKIRMIKSNIDFFCLQ